MHIDVIMPQMGESVVEGTITRWLKAVGDKVERDEPLFEISTDKVDAEIPAPAAGYVAKILVPEGETVEINTVVAVISSEAPAVGDSSEASRDSSGQSPPDSGAATSTGAPRGPQSIAESASAGSTGRPGGVTKTGGISPGQAPLSKEPGSRTTGPEGGTPPGGAPPGGTPPGGTPPGGTPPGAGGSSASAPTTLETLRRVKSSPLVRRIAKEHNIDIRRLQGSGLSGRVTKKDILAHIEAMKNTEPAGALEPAPARPVKATVSHDIPSHFLASPGARDEIRPMSVMRRKISEHMSWSKRISSHVNSFLEIDMTRIVQLRKRNKDAFIERSGEKLTYMPFILAATVSALKAYPDCNASVLGDDIVYHKDIHLGVAVALDWGLIVPVIRNADEKNLLGLTRSLNDLADRARRKKLLPDEVAGGTFSVTNPGAFGSLTGTPIISQPQVAILGVGAINKRPWVMEGPEGDSIAIRHIMMMSLAYDHRLVDGATGSRFLNHIRDTLESFDEAQLW